MHCETDLSTELDGGPRSLRVANGQSPRGAAARCGGTLGVARPDNRYCRGIMMVEAPLSGGVPGSRVLNLCRDQCFGYKSCRLLYLGVRSPSDSARSAGCRHG